MSCSQINVCCSLPAGGPDIQLQAPYYSIRMSYTMILSCSSYPCSRTNLYNTNSSSMTFNSEAERNATLDALLPLAIAEYNLDDQTLQVGIYQLRRAVPGFQLCLLNDT